MTEETRRNDSSRAPAWMRVVIATGVVLAVLLVGASAGLLVQLPERGSTEPGPGSVDVGFSQDMSVHHRQAVLMAGIARDRSTDPAIRTLAYDIETTQLEQIGRMQGWLSLWDASALPTGNHMTWMAGTGHSGHGSAHGSGGVAVMPGMASGEELARLQRVSGPELDVLFLQLMLRHHQGGTPMLRYAQVRAEVPQLRNLARQMLTAQTKESDYMARLLAERGAAPLPAPA
ncbi:MAG: DUF305 domain-containing protein [Pseudonocardiaceae bacterium]